MPEGLRNLYGATEQASEQVNEQDVVKRLQRRPSPQVSYLAFWTTLPAILVTIPANSSMFS